MYQSIRRGEGLQRFEDVYVKVPLMDPITSQQPHGQVCFITDCNDLISLCAVTVGRGQFVTSCDCCQG